MGNNTYAHKVLRRRVKKLAERAKEKELAKKKAAMTNDRKILYAAIVACVFIAIALIAVNC